MARIRSVKPEVLKHEGLFDLERETGLPIRFAWIGLWTQCDREGRFEWRPRQLGADILPYDDIDFSRVLDALATRGFIVRYRVPHASGSSAGKDYGFIPSWRKHQVVNNRERSSDIPEPKEKYIVDNELLTRDARDDDATMTRPPRDDDASATREPRVPHGARKEGKGKEGEGKGEESESFTPPGSPSSAPAPDSADVSAPPGGEAAAGPARWGRFTNEEVIGIADRCLDLIGRKGDPTVTMGIVYQWLADGADPDKHIYPTIQSVVADNHGAAIGTLRYFDKAVRRAMAGRSDGIASNGGGYVSKRHHVDAAEVDAMVANQRQRRELFGEKPMTADEEARFRDLAKVGMADSA